MADTVGPPPPSEQGMSRLLSLPYELRQQIYKHVLIDELIKVNESVLLAFRTYPDLTTQPGLTRANRQLRGETLSIYYGNNMFAFWLDGNNDRMDRWLSAIGDTQTSKLRHFSLRANKRVNFGHMVVNRSVQLYIHFTPDGVSYSSGNENLDATWAGNFYWIKQLLEYSMEARRSKGPSEKDVRDMIKFFSDVCVEQTDFRVHFGGSVDDIPLNLERLAMINR